MNEIVAEVMIKNITITGIKQNIPSHEKSIRMMFRATPGNVMVGSDFS